MDPKIRRNVRVALEGLTDAVRANTKDGTFTAKRFYFYHHGMTAESFEKDVLAGLRAAGLAAVSLERHDRFHAWPKDSWLEVKFRLA